MPYIYEPKGKAGEYGKYALNLYNGCTHGCRYCYCPAIMHKTRDQFHAVGTPRFFDYPKLMEEIKQHQGKSLFLCFTCDPYQPANEEHNLTGRIIEVCHYNEIKVVILTKGGKRSEKDLGLLAKNPNLSEYGVTLTFLEDVDSLSWEPHAALPMERITILRKAHDMGIPTWVSLEPVIDPIQSLEIIRTTHDYVDVFKVGKWNHDKEASKINWPKFAKDAVNLLNELGAQYYIKKDLAIFLNGFMWF